MPGAKFGVAFCESSGKALIRYDGTDDDSTQLAIDFASRLSAGHVFVVILSDSYPINVLNRIKSVEEVANIYCATANSVNVIVAESEGRRGILGIMDGAIPRGVESDADKQERKEFLEESGTSDDSHFDVEQAQSWRFHTHPLMLPTGLRAITLVEIPPMCMVSTTSDTSLYAKPASSANPAIVADFT